MKKAGNYKKWRVLISCIVSLIAGFHLIFYPYNVNHWVIRAIGVVWFFEGMVYLLEFIMLKYENSNRK